MPNKTLLNQLNRLETKHKLSKAKAKPSANHGSLKVYYGWAKLGKVRKREAISVIFENEPCAGTHHRYSKTLKKTQDTVYVREQSEEESLDAKLQNRVFTEYSIFMDDKAVNGNLETALQINFEADKNHVPEDVRLEIKEKLKSYYLLHH